VHRQRAKKMPMPNRWRTRNNVADREIDEALGAEELVSMPFRDHPLVVAGARKRVANQRRDTGE
jgi:hypothetical protein